MTVNYKRGGGRRLGDHYQDLIALDLLITMLEKPDKYNYIEVEADDAGSLDDVKALRKDGTCSVIQVKFKTNLEKDKLSWEYLTKRKKGKKGFLKSLLQKWASSLEELQEKYDIHKGCLVTNLELDTEFKRSILHNKVNFDKIEDSNTRELLIEQLGEKSKVEKFFSNFYFYHDCLDIEKLNESIFKRYERLGGTEKGWINLIKNLREWVTEKNNPSPNGLITLEIIKKAALWHQFRSIPQQFKVPKDYVLPSKDFHNNLKKELLKLKKGSLVITGSPGVGKSTYLSFLFNELVEKNIPVIRHHYFLSLSDRTVDRLKFQTIAESLMDNIQKNYPEALNQLESKNPSFMDFSNWIETCANYFFKQEYPLIIIIDGLDHSIESDRDLEELKTLIEHLIPTPNGIIIIFGMQKIDSDILPSKFIESSPRNTWKEIPLLEKESVKEYLFKHKNDIQLDDDHPNLDYMLNKLTDAFFEKSKGHPLHLKYTLKTIKEQDILVTKENIEELPGINHHEIEEYYYGLWHVLNGKEREILYLLASCPFSWPLDGIVDCFKFRGMNTPEIIASLKRVKHLLEEKTLGFELDHPSMLIFIEKQEYYELHAQKMKEYALDWIENSAPTFWKRAYEWLLKADLGTYEPLIDGPDRQWAIENIANGFPKPEVVKIFIESTYNAIQKGNFKRFIELRILSEYFLNAYTDRHELIDKLLYPQLMINDVSYVQKQLIENIDYLTIDGLALIAENNALNNKKIPWEFIDLANKKLENPIDYGDYFFENIEHLLKIVALCPNINPERILEYILHFKKKWLYREGEHYDTAYTLLNIYSQVLRIYHNLPGMSHSVMYLRKFLEMEIDSLEMSAILRNIVLLSIEEGFVLEEIKNNSSDPFAAIYAAINEIEDFEIGTIVFPDNNDNSIFYFEYYQLLGNEKRIENMFYRAFFCFLGNYLWKKDELNKEWINGIYEFGWLKKFLFKLDLIASNVSKFIISKEPLSYSWIYGQLEDMGVPDASEDSEIHQFYNGATSAMNYIGLDIFLLLQKFGSMKINKDDLLTVVNSDFCTLWKWVDAYWNYRKKLISEESVEWLLDYCVENLSASFNELFSDRASHFGSLASIAALYGLNQKSKCYLMEAASNLISYGDRKDPLLNNTMEIIDLCAKYGRNDALLQLKKLIPAIVHITEFTDGDGTKHLPSKLGVLLSKIDSCLIPDYYQYLCSKEDYDNALHVFHSFLKVADLSDEFNKTLAETAMDLESLNILFERAQKGDVNAEVLVNPFKDRLSRKVTEDILKDSDLVKSEKKDKMKAMPSDYPPEKLKEYINLDFIFLDKRIENWIDYWEDKGKGKEVLEAIEKLEAKYIDLRAYDRIFDLVYNLYGKSRAYPWLVKAQIDSHGWSYWGYREQSKRRCNIIKNDYPDKWFEFIQDVYPKVSCYQPYRLEIVSQLIRIIKYLLLMEKNDLAYEITDQVVDSTLELLSPINLPSPKWRD